MRPAIEVSGLSKRYVIEHESRHDNLRDTLHHTARKLWRRFRWGTGFAKEEFWALRDVSFAVQPGEVVGIIGRNGAGKSTLLKILSRITEATSGKVTLRGRVASLLEVGTGFHPDLTGRENIFLNGAILGMSRAEIRRKFDEIVAFAEIERFLDTPVKRYSSGMYVRLAFAVAAHLEPEILIVDEVLAVGDIGFQKKCLGKIQDVSRKQGRAVLFVSHNMDAVTKLTGRAIFLETGRVRMDGPTEKVVESFIGEEDDALAQSYDVKNMPRAWAGNGEARFVRVWFERTVPRFSDQAEIIFCVEAQAGRSSVREMRLSLTLFTADGAAVGSGFSRSDLQLEADQTLRFKIYLSRLGLAPGQYHFGLSLGRGDHRTGHVDFDVIGQVLRFEIESLAGQDGTLASWPRGWGPLVLPELKLEKVG